jgi:putative flippase GtrA
VRQQSRKVELRRFLKFAIVGAIGTVIDFGLMNAFFLLFNRTMMINVDASRLFSSIISFTAAVINNFILNRIWTYADLVKKPFLTQLMQFSAISIIGLLIRTPLIGFLANLIRNLLEKTSSFPTLDPIIFGNNAALAISIVVVLLWNFFANRFWTFRELKK